MMRRKNGLAYYFATGCLAIGATGLTTGCDDAEVQAVVAGIQIVADALDGLQDDKDDDISFGDWLLDELED